MATSRAAVVTGFNAPLEMRDVQIPDLEYNAGLGKVDAATLCGTDVHFWHGALPGSNVPYVPGHETVTRIVEMNGPKHDVLGGPLRTGDRVIVAYPFCGECFYCAVANQPTLCPNGARFGRMKTDEFPYLLGGAAEYHYLPPASKIVKVPDEVSSPLAASAACALRTVMHGFERLGPVASHEVIAVQGCGPVGLYATAVAKDHGARKVLTIGAPSDRLEVARAWGADATLNMDDEPDAAKRKQWVLDQTDGRGPDVVLQCATTAAIPEGLDFIRGGGRYVSIGGGSGQMTIPGVIFTKFITIYTVRAAEGRHFYQALQFLATRKDIPFDRLITGEYPIERTGEALQAMAEMKQIKPVLLPN
jgi:threonine dehydrogenase-like Zn-dependent dehydrogenase